jgi:hypothetical protein
VVAQAPLGTLQANVMVVPDFLPRTIVFPKAELLMTTSASVAPTKAGSVAPLIVPMIESPPWTFHFVWLRASPVRGSVPVGRSRLPGPLLSETVQLSPAAGRASMRTTSANTAATRHDAAVGRESSARTSMR